MAGRIVVGIDGSEAADYALWWAFEEAKLRHAKLEVVHAWTIPAIGDPVGMAAADPGIFQRAAAHRLSAVVDLTLGDHPEVEVEEHLIHGDAATALLTQAAGADILVVGSHGHGGFVGLLLGSVSHKCAIHAPCPIAIIRRPSGSTKEVA